MASQKTMNQRVTLVLLTTVALMSLLTIAASVYRTNLQAEVVDVHYR
jgi:hypothetical protein